MFTYGNYIDEVLMRNPVIYYVHDHLYSPVALVWSTGTVIERYEYDAYGEPNILDASYNKRSSSLYANPYYLTGRTFDFLDNGSLTLADYRHRSYDSYAGRFLQNDPLGINPQVLFCKLVKSHFSEKLEYYKLFSLYENKTSLCKRIHTEMSPQVPNVAVLAAFINQSDTDRFALCGNDNIGKPKGLLPEKQYTDGLNLYEYAKSNPITISDCMGLSFNWSCDVSKITIWACKFLSKIPYYNGGAKALQLGWCNNCNSLCAFYCNSDVDECEVDECMRQCRIKHTDCLMDVRGKGCQFEFEISGGCKKKK